MPDTNSAIFGAHRPWRDSVRRKLRREGQSRAGQIGSIHVFSLKT